MKSPSTLQKLAWVYALMFFIIGTLAYMPGLTDAEGYLFGLFHLDWWDDALHIGSGLWAAAAAWRSRWATNLFFKLFGVIYGMDGVVGFLLGQGYLDGGIFQHGPDLTISWGTKFAANLPHIIIGGGAALIGFWLSQRLDAEPKQA